MSWRSQPSDETGTGEGAHGCHAGTSDLEVEAEVAPRLAALAAFRARQAARSRRRRFGRAVALTLLGLGGVAVLRLGNGGVPPPRSAVSLALAVSGRVDRRAERPEPIDHPGPVALDMVVAHQGLVEPPTAKSPATLPSGDASRPRSGPRRLSSAPGSPPTGNSATESGARRLEIIASRYGVVRKTPTEWEWAWRLTAQRYGSSPTVNLRIEFIEFQGKAGRVVLGAQELCDVRVAAGPLVTITGTHTLDAATAERVTALTATESKAARCGRRP
jgi:hypothetical protein